MHHHCISSCNKWIVHQGQEGRVGWETGNESDIVTSLPLAKSKDFTT